MTGSVDTAQERTSHCGIKGVEWIHWECRKDYIKVETRPLDDLTAQLTHWYCDIIACLLTHYFDSNWNRYITCTNICSAKWKNPDKCMM